MNNKETVTIPKEEYERLLSLEKKHQKPKRPQPKSYALFTLTMPGVGSWNGKWSGEGRYYAKAKRVFNRGKPLYDNIIEKNYYYHWEDNWTAKINMTLVTEKEAKAAVKKSKGFLGYDWMCDSILKNGRIQNENNK